MRYNTLGIHVTDTCNMTCGHCITDSSPQARGDLAWEEINDAVRSAAPQIDGVCVTGGEPLLRPDITYATIALAHSLGLVASLITNGFWAKTEKRAHHVFFRLKRSGLNKMGVSADGYHDEKITSDGTLERLLALASRYEIPCKIQYCGPDKGAALDRVRALAQRHGAELLTSEVLPFGRGLQIAARRHADIANVPDEACGVAVRPVYTPQGDLYTCCGPARGATDGSPLRLPASGGRDVGDALRKASSDPLLNVIHLQGPRALYERLSPATRERVAGRLLDESFCSLCRAITDDPDAVAELREELEPERWRLVAAAAYMQVNTTERA